MTVPPPILLIAHCPSVNLTRMALAVGQGAGLTLRSMGAFEASSTDVMAAKAVVLLTPENFGTMSGALKDFFDRTYSSLLGRCPGLPYALVVRAGQSAGDGCSRSVAGIAQALGWKAVQPPLIISGDFDPGRLDDCRDLGAALAQGLALGIF